MNEPWLNFLLQAVKSKLMVIGGLFFLSYSLIKTGKKLPSLIPSMDQR